MMDNTKILLAAGGSSEWKIVISKEASASERYAAQELQNFFGQVSGAVLPIIDDSTAEAAHEIQLGLSDRTKALEPEVQALGQEGLLIRTEPGKLILVGGAPRGTLYAVYEFLEDYLGCRWLTPAVSKIPKKNRVEIPAIDMKYVPPLEYRGDFYFDAFDGDWAARNRSNGEQSNLEARHGGKVKYNKIGFGHTFGVLVPVEEFYDTHPEYFSEVDGVRIREHAQLCLTNPDVLRIATERVLKAIGEEPDAQIISITQNDWFNPCQCERCKAIDEREGSYSGTLLHFVNQIAEAVAKSYPDKKVDTFAYQYTRKPPKYIKPAKNVIVRLCSIECCFAHPLEACREVGSRWVDLVRDQPTFLDDLIGWSKICNQLYVWDYVVNFHNLIMPFPNFQVLAPNIRLAIRNHVTGIFEEGNGWTAGGEMEELRAYVLAKLLWNPELDTDELINEFLTGYYDMAAGPIRSYLNLMRDKVVSENIHMGIYEPPMAPYLTADILDKADALFDEAETLADDEEILKRVRTARLPIEYVRAAKMKKGVPGREAAIERFFDKVRAEGITMIREGFTVEETEEMMMNATGQFSEEKLVKGAFTDGR